MPLLLKDTCSIFQTALVHLLKEEELVDTITVCAHMRDDVLTVSIKVIYNSDVANSMGSMAAWREGKRLNNVILEYVHSQALLGECTRHTQVKVVPPGITKADVDEGRANDPSHPMFRPRRHPYALVFGFALPHTQIHNLAKHEMHV
jgi:hypothetical protein